MVGNRMAYKTGAIRLGIKLDQLDQVLGDFNWESHMSRFFYMKEHSIWKNCFHLLETYKIALR